MYVRIRVSGLKWIRLLHTKVKEHFKFASALLSLSKQPFPADHVICWTLCRLLCLTCTCENYVLLQQRWSISENRKSTSFDLLSTFDAIIWISNVTWNLISFHIGRHIQKFCQILYFYTKRVILLKYYSLKLLEIF